VKRTTDISELILQRVTREKFGLFSYWSVCHDQRMSTRKKNPVATRATILRHAGEEFCRMGFQAARLNAIVENSGITKGALFHHFAGKDDLCLQWLQETLPALLESTWLAPLRAGEDNPLDTIHSILREQVRVIEQTPRREFTGNPLATLTSSVPIEDCPLQKAMTELMQQWHQSISEALRKGQSRKTVHAAIQASDEAHLIIALMTGLELQARSRGSGIAAGFLRAAVAYLETLRPA
jgi:AcrR family transcriptional regulator